MPRVLQKWIDDEGGPESVLAIMAFALFGGIIFYLLKWKIEAENKELLIFMLGVLVGLLKDTWARYYSATKGAQEQRKETAAVTQTLANTAAAVAAQAVPASTITTTTKVERTDDAGATSQAAGASAGGPVNTDTAALDIIADAGRAASAAASGVTAGGEPPDDIPPGVGGAG